ncbi:hypothetical protein UY3_10245 [Chelonia mydas]|uniref:Uncharacterized protein n=1 Tax=Chelonia mydas TaxID=8469 RepID=M7B629_CHEMY|nr:hypothetical protein UY3_10245 [Chelonia mydas]
MALLWPSLPATLLATCRASPPELPAGHLLHLSISRPAGCTSPPATCCTCPPATLLATLQDIFRAPHSTQLSVISAVSGGAKDYPKLCSVLLPLRCWSLSLLQKKTVSGERLLQGEPLRTGSGSSLLLEPFLTTAKHSSSGERVWQLPTIGALPLPQGETLEPWPLTPALLLDVDPGFRQVLAMGTDPQPLVQIPSPGHAAADTNPRLWQVLALDVNLQSPLHSSWLRWVLAQDTDS